MRRVFWAVVFLAVLPALVSAQTTRLVIGTEARTIASNGSGTAATLTFTPLTSHVAITCNDTDGCAITLGETSLPGPTVNGRAASMSVTITNVSANAVTLADSAGVQELQSSISLAQWASTTCTYEATTWVCGGSGGGAGTVTTTGSPASGNLAFFSGGTSVTSGNLSGDVTTSGTGAVTIANDVVSNAKLRNSGALSVIGRAANSSGDPADISASAASGAVLRESGSTIGFGTIATAGIADGAVTLPKIVDASAATRLLCRGSAAGSGDWEECTLGTNLSMGGTVLNSSTTGTGVFSSSIYLNYQDQKAQNTAGGTCTSGSFQTRTINTEVADAGGLGTLAANQITLTAGTYIIAASSPAFKVDRHQIRLQNATAATTVLTGRSSYASNAFNGFSTADLMGIFTIAASQALEIQHRCGTTEATDGFGVENNFTTEIYTIVELWKIG